MMPGVGAFLPVPHGREAHGVMFYAMQNDT